VPARVAHPQSYPAQLTFGGAYWDPAHDVAVAECSAEWVTDPAAREHAWACFRAAPPPLGHDPATIWPGGLADALVPLDE
jgi:hypothetical protein